MITRRAALAGLSGAIVGLPGRALPQGILPIRVAIVGPMTGPDAHVGALMREGARAAVAAINGRGGVLGRLIELSEADDANQPSQAVSVANRVVNDAGFVVGHALTTTTMPASDVYAERGVVLLAPVNGTALTERGAGSIFRILPSTVEFAAPVADLILASEHRHSLAILHNKTEYGAGIGAAVKRRLNEGGCREVLFDGVNPGEKDHSAIITRLKSLGARAAFLALYPGDAGLLVRQAADQAFSMGGAGPAYYGVSSLNAREYYAVGGQATADTLVISVRGGDLDDLRATLAGDKSNEAFLEGLAAQGVQQHQLDVTHVIIASAFEVLFQAISAAGTSEPRFVARAIHEREFKTVRGELAFSASGGLSRPERTMSLYRWRADGRCVLVRNLV